MLSREDVEQMINQKIEPLTEEIAALKVPLNKVDLLSIDSRNIRQSLGRIETTQIGLKPDFERQEKCLVRFEEQTNDKLTDIKNDTTIVKADITTIKEQLALTIALLRFL